MTTLPNIISLSFLKIVPCLKNHMHAINDKIHLNVEMTTLIIEDKIFKNEESGCREEN